jgi:hypothetical protein
MTVRTFASALLAIYGLAAQSTVAVDGKVIDVSTNSGIPGATVEVADSHNAGVGTLHTGADGSFHIELPSGGKFNLRWRADGYAQPDEYTVISTQPGSSIVGLTLAMTRNAAISGAVVDEETSKPIANVRVWPKQVSYLRGRRELLISGEAVVTDGDGAFVAKNLPPGDYVLEVNGSFAVDDASARIREGYPRTYWPGPGDFEGAVPVRVPAGSMLDVGNVKLRKKDLVGLTVSVVGGACTNGQTYGADLIEDRARSWFSIATLRVPCGRSAKFPNVDPGEYWLRVSASWQREEDREMGIAPVQVWNRDLEVSVAITPPIRIHGKISLERSGGKADGQQSGLPRGLEVSLPPPLPGTGGYISPFSVSAGKVSPDGSFESTSYMPPGGKLQVAVSGMPKNYYVKEVLYNGSRGAGRIFAFNPGAIEQDLEIVCSDRSGALSGTVRDEGGNAIGNAKVLLAPWPANIVSQFPYDATETDADSSGHFAFTGLTPGNYRVIAVPPAARPKLEEPGILVNLFAATDPVEIGEAAAAYRNVALSSGPTH